MEAQREFKKREKIPLNSKVFMDISLRRICAPSSEALLLLVPAHVNAEKASESFNGSQPGRKWGTGGVNL